MRITKELIAVAMLGLIPTAMAWAAEGTVSDEPVPATNQEANDSPSDLEAPDGPALVTVGDACGVGCACTNCYLGEPWRMPQLCALQDRGIMVGGWIQQGITFNSRNPADGFNGPVVTNDMNSEYQMNQLWMYAVKPVNTGGYGWDIGGRIDMMYGTDGRFGANFGLEDRINGLETYGIVIPQAYVEVAYNNLSVKLGHFAGILDYEVVPSPGNPFYSLSYGYTYGVPQLVTGALADYKLTDELSVQVAAHRGWMMFEDANSDWDIMAGVKWESYDGGSSLAWSCSTGPQDPVGGDLNGIPGDQERFVYSLVWQQQMTERLRYVLVHNLGRETGGGADAEWYGLNNYFLYKINPCLAANLRLEWFRDDDGARVAGAGNIPGMPAWTGGGFVGDFFNLTAGVTWRPHPNVIVRPEARWDWYDGAAGVVGGAAGFPFDAGASDDQFTLAADLIITY
ncbi:MAG: porin [Planctomycetes bacterium]|nr:porin [Planctomycetota bacterium]MBL7039053.1 porin [Pirellulaceae bacterium]